MMIITFRPRTEIDDATLNCYDKRCGRCEKPFVGQKIMEEWRTLSLFSFEPISNYFFFLWN